MECQGEGRSCLLLNAGCVHEQGKRENEESVTARSASAGASGLLLSAKYEFCSKRAFVPLESLAWLLHLIRPQLDSWKA